MLKDRGNIKWTAMMLPEHVEMVKKIYKDQHKTAKPILDEQTLYEIDLAVQEALRRDKEVSFRYWDNGYYKELVGRVNFVDYVRKQFRIIIQENKKCLLDFNDVISVTLTE